MSNRKDIQDELKGMDAHFSAEANNGPFTVPEGYFDGLAGSILEKIKGSAVAANDEIKELSPLLAGISRDMPYSVPQGYFNGLSEELPVLIAPEADSQILATIGKTMPFEVPAGYFEQLAGQVLAKVTKPAAKVIPVLSRKWMRMAVAAVTSGIIFLSGYTYFLGQGHRPNTGSGVVASLKKVPTPELDEFLKTIDVNAAGNTQTAVNNASQGTTDVKQMLQGIPENEIDAFLKQVPSDNDDLAIN